MTETELLVQRFVDQELSPEERLRFVARLGRDEALRQQVLEIEHVLSETRRFERPDVPAGFVAAVMRRTDADPSVWSRVRALLWRPRALRWNMAGALAAACVVVAAVGGALAVGRQWAPDQSRIRMDREAATPSPVMVRLLVIDRAATTVAVAGDFNGWDPARTPLARVSNEGWAVTLSLEPGRYEYMFVLDGKTWIADPFAAEKIDDGFGSSNAVLEIRGPGGSPL